MSAKGDEGRAIASGLVDEWLALREELKAIERAEHPDITDGLGRVWTWWQGDLYLHDGMAWPADHIGPHTQGWPKRALLDNPNYRWCGHCVAHADEWPT